MFGVDLNPMVTTARVGFRTAVGCLARFRGMFENSDDEWVAGLDVEYTIVLGREKDLKDEVRKNPAMIQVCVHNVCLVYHICHADVECQDFKNFHKDKTVKFVTVDFKNDRDVLHRICLVVGQPSISKRQAWCPPLNLQC